jgi:spermidine synthase
MLPWIQLDRATIPGDDGELRLKQRGSEFSIMLGSNELMNSRLSGSEEALATLGCAPIAGRKNASVLIGGLGMGFTLRAALGALADDAHVVVAELVSAVVDWARGPMADLYDGALDNPRVNIHVGDVGALIRSTKPASYDAILLDVDNGPDGLTRASNDSLYDHKGLRAAKTALRAGGVLAVWSSAPDSTFTRRLRDVGFAADEVNVRANGKRGGARHVLWIATKP